MSGSSFLEDDFENCAKCEELKSLLEAPLKLPVVSCSEAHIILPVTVLNCICILYTIPKLLYLARLAFNAFSQLKMKSV